MNSQDFNQLPMLPDPADQPSVPAAPITVPSSAPMPAKKPVRNKYLRFGVTAAVFVAVILLVFFGQHIGELFHLFGTKAGQSVILDGSNFKDTGWYGDPNNNCFTMTADGKLALSNPGDGSCTPGLAHPL